MVLKRLLIEVQKLEKEEFMNAPPTQVPMRDTNKKSVERCSSPEKDTSVRPKQVQPKLQTQVHPEADGRVKQKRQMQPRHIMNGGVKQLLQECKHVIITFETF